ncbi:hypothetical protein [Oceanibaculum sp.]|uniref:hypothetical protein n=1 Tax=Oceanibaculum sp. TaxID=1903597 RepID=UPI00259006BA|nr:hypothetical protein [Oceanibaculum sp.]MCH2394395.1 hypothetical protein [Oceanibaculum sp.]
MRGNVRLGYIPGMAPRADAPALLSRNGFPSTILQRQAIRSGGTVVQRKVIVNGGTLWSYANAWRQVQADIPREYHAAAYSLLRSWVLKPGEISVWGLGRVWSGTEHTYADYNELARALVGEVRAAGNLQRETRVASRLYNSNWVIQRLQSLMGKIYNHFRGRDQNWWSAVQGNWRGAWGYWGPTSLVGGVLATLQRPYNDIKNNFAAIRMVSLQVFRAARGMQVNQRRGGRDGGYQQIVAPRIDAMRRNAQSPREDWFWTREAREAGVPLGAGPSTTLNHMFSLAQTVGATADEIRALGLAGFVFFNQNYSWLAADPHRLHEIFDIARQYGIDYDVSQYGDFLTDIERRYA